MNFGLHTDTPASVPSFVTWPSEKEFGDADDVLFV